MTSLFLRRVARQIRPRHLLSSYRVPSKPEPHLKLQMLSTTAPTQPDQSSDSGSSISKLVSLIRDAAKVIEDNYAAAATSKDLKIPSLDSISPHPLDSEIMSPEMRVAVETLEGACAQLVDTVGNPNHILMNRFMEFYYHAALNIVLTHKIPDAIQAKPEGMHISEIQERSGINQYKIGRVLRTLASRHIFKEVEENVFANNRLSIHLLSSNPLADMGQHFGDEALRSSLHLAEVLGHEEWGHSFSHTKTAFNRHTGYHGNLFEHYEHDHPIGTHRGARFGRGLIAWAAALESRAVVHGYPWKELGDDVVVCDLGSGVGTMSIEMARAYPNLRFVLQDLPERLKQGRHEIWPERSPGAMDRVQWVPVNFFKDPPVSGCDVYFLKNIIHDWSDEIAIDVLSNVRHAMAPHSRVLVQEHILQHPFRVPDSESVARQAPEPLLANYGVGRIRQFYVDMQLLNVMNSEVRTLAQYNKLAEAAGLEYVKVWDLGETSVMEYRLRQ